MSNAVLKSQCGNGSAKKEFGSRTKSKTSQCINCEIRIEECCDGCKIYCTCCDKAECKTLQNLCRTVDGGLCSVRSTCDGQPCCDCCFAGCDCRCEMTADGVCICCTTNDAACLKIVSAMCRCLCACRECGCECTVYVNDKPVCCCEC